MQSAEYYLKVFNIYLLGVVAHTCDPSTWEAELGGS
jgi:hypothetical protein